MKRPVISLVAALATVGTVGVVGYLQGYSDSEQGESRSFVRSAFAKEKAAEITPTQALPDPNVYYPGTEELKPDEMRLISCGTGMPTARESQAATCWLLELGNGDKFLFDVGTGSGARVASMRIPYEFLNKIFLSHLHTDHFGDFAAYFVGGWLAGRQGPLHVYGPSGARPETGTKYAIEHYQKALTWDIEGRAGRIPASGGKVIVHEFDYKGKNEIVYQENDVTIRSWPANHVIDGPVSYSLEWNGLKFVFGGDTYPNKWYVEYAKGADLAIHECFITVSDMVEKFGFSVSTALEVGTQIHTTAPAILEGVRSTYDGPLTLAEDYMVWNITKDDIRMRTIAYNPDMWPPPGAKPPPAVDRSITQYVSKWIPEQNLDVDKIVETIYDRTNKQYGTNEKPNQ
jgi:ribonuclease Z